jgi:hypothetical protein
MPFLQIYYSLMMMLRTLLLAAASARCRRCRPSWVVRQLLHLSACNKSIVRGDQIYQEDRAQEEERFDNLQVIIIVGHGSATGVPWCVAPETFHPASKVVLVASRPDRVTFTEAHMH